MKPSLITSFAYFYRKEKIYYYVKLNVSFLVFQQSLQQGRKRSKIHLFGNTSADTSVCVYDLFLLQIQTNLDTNDNFSAFFRKY